MPRAPLGQHFLKDPAALASIVEALPVAPGTFVIEVGPGRGVLTVPLSKKIAAVPGASLVCIERDASLATELGGRRWEGTAPRIILGDVRTALPAFVAELPPGRRYSVVGNIPYYLTGRLFRILAELPALPERIVLTVQREVAERLTARPPKMNLLAATAAGWADATVVTVIPRTSFAPPPKVESAVVSLVPTRETPLPPAYFRTARALFRQPRQTLLNNLARVAPRAEASRLLEAEGLDPGARPQTLTAGAILRLSSTGLFS